MDGVTSVSTVRVPVKEAGPVRGRNDAVDSELTVCCKVAKADCSAAPLIST